MLNNPRRPNFRPTLRTAVVLGDSITASSFAQVNGQMHFGLSFSEKAAWRAGMKVLYNAGVPGQTSAQIYSRLQTDVLARQPDACIIMSGTNDVTAGTFGTPAAAAYMNYIEKMVLGCLSAGIYPFICVPPAKTGVPDAYKNRYFYYLLAEFYGLPLIDMCAATIDVNDSLGGILAAYTIDGTHPSAAGTDRMAALLAPVLLNPQHNLARLPYLSVFPETSFGAPGNLLYNGNFIHLTSNIPDGWTVNATNATVSYPPPIYPYTGNTYRYVKSDTAQVLLLNSFNVGVANGGYVVGDTLHVAVRVASSNMGPINYSAGLNVEMTYDNPAGDAFQFESVSGINEDQIFSGLSVVPSGTNNAQLVLALSQSGTYLVNNATIINRSRYQSLWQPGLQ